MKYLIEKSKLEGEVEIPASKSHTVRAVMFATLAGGISRIIEPLDSDDTRSAVKAGASLGASFDRTADGWIIQGVDGQINGLQTEIDTGNSGTTIRIATGVAALARNSDITLTGDEQIQNRPIGQLVAALNRLGA
ncbi:MAG: 3-phosphoshikimate 1-carboxyvinyltransferase, partial [bacterium]